MTQQTCDISWCIHRELWEKILAFIVQMISPKYISLIFCLQKYSKKNVQHPSYFSHIKTTLNYGQMYFFRHLRIGFWAIFTDHRCSPVHRIKIWLPKKVMIESWWGVLMEWTINSCNNLFAIPELYRFTHVCARRRPTMGLQFAA